MAGFGPIKKMIVDYTVANTFQVYLGVGATLYAARWYSTQTTYNYWFGKHDF